MVHSAGRRPAKPGSGYGTRRTRVLGPVPPPIHGYDGDDDASPPDGPQGAQLEHRIPIISREIHTLQI
jgi:hypothetical protein